MGVGEDHEEDRHVAHHANQEDDDVGRDHGGLHAGQEDVQLLHVAGPGN